MSNDSLNIFGIHVFLDNCISQHQSTIHNKNVEYLSELWSFSCCFNSLLLFKILFHHSFNRFFYDSVFIENRMTLIAGFNFDWSFYCCVHCKRCSTDAVYLNLFEVLRMDSFFRMKWSIEICFSLSRVILGFFLMIEKVQTFYLLYTLNVRHHSGKAFFLIHGLRDLISR